VSARNALDEIQTAETNNALLIPLSQSLYVPGNLTRQNKVLVELGTGYFCEKSIPQAKDLIERKVIK
jgi:prefoldin alpha subunit